MSSSDTINVFLNLIPLPEMTEQVDSFMGFPALAGIFSPNAIKFLKVKSTKVECFLYIVDTCFTFKFYCKFVTNV